MNNEMDRLINLNSEIKEIEARIIRKENSMINAQHDVEYKIEGIIRSQTSE